MNAVADKVAIWARRHWLVRVVAAACLFISSAAFAQGTDYVEHRVKRDQNPYSLARDYMNSAENYRAIMQINRIPNPRKIPVGTIVRLPRSLLAYRSADLRIAAFSGDVTIDGQPAARGMPVPEGAMIRTGGRGFVSLRDGTGAVLTMPTNTEGQLVRSRTYRLDDLKDVEFKILRGRGEAQVPGLRPRERYKITTPTTVSAVRGTIFRVGYEENGQRTVVEVVEGAVGTVAGTQEAVTSAGFGLAATASGLSPLEPLGPPPEIANPGAIQTRPQVSFAVALPASAAGTRTQIARDAGFIDIVGEQISIGAQPATFSEIPNGRYFVRARAISATGIEGSSEVYSFRRKRLGARASVQPAALRDGFRFAWLQDGEGETTYAFQLWNTERPAELIVDETAMTRDQITISDLAPGIYEWRVAAMQVDEEGLLQVWAPTQRLYVTE